MLLNDVRFSERLGSIPRTLTFPDGAMFETSDNGRVDQWLMQCGQRSSRRHRLERNSSIVGIALAVIALVVFVSVRWGIPAFSDYIAERLPPEVDAAIATGALEALEMNCAPSLFARMPIRSSGSTLSCAANVPTEQKAAQHPPRSSKLPGRCRGKVPLVVALHFG